MAWRVGVECGRFKGCHRRLYAGLLLSGETGQKRWQTMRVTGRFAADEGGAQPLIIRAVVMATREAEKKA